MKHQAVYSAVVFAIAGLSLLSLNLVSVGAQTSTDEASESVALVESFFEALQAEDLETIAPLIAGDAVLVQPMTFSGQTTTDALTRYEGHDEIMGFLTGLTQTFEPIAFSSMEFTPNADGSVVFVEMRGEFVTDPAVTDGVAAPYNNLYVVRFEIADGQFVAVREYFNPVSAAVVLGFELGVTE